MGATVLLTLAGVILVAWGLKLIFYGGTRRTDDDQEWLGFMLGGDEVQMSRFECWLSGLLMMAGGFYLFARIYAPD